MNNKTKFLVSVLVAILFFAPPVFSSEFNEETIVVKELAQNHSFHSENPGHDPFKPIISRPEVKMPEPLEFKTDKEPKIEKKAKKVVKPLNIKITGICGNDKQRQAVIVFDNKELLVEAGNKIDNSFKIIEISAQQVVVYSIKETRRRVFKIS
jgi:hypothetical protein